ncbi:hypothetical protein J6590_027403 [Homalodisca vitripennis]|nr:hypothetical protein J6590_027403 [Homalodisca vitripennis]
MNPSLFFSATKNFIEVVNRMRRRRSGGLVSWGTAVKFLAARKFDVARAVALYEQHEATRQREGLVHFDPTQEPLKSELDTGKFTILLKEQQNFWKSSNGTFLTHPPYSPDLAPSDFYLFPYMKRWLASQRSASDEELQNAVKEFCYSVTSIKAMYSEDYHKAQS